jgi:tripartite-type tricarboxylate transporter receptor subunit TctC
MAEAGQRGVEAYTWQGLLAPAQTPQPIIGRLNRVLRTAIEDPAIRARANEIGVPVAASTPEEFRSEFEADLRKWSIVIQTAGIERQ